MRRISLNLSFKNEIAYYSASKHYDLFYPPLLSENLLMMSKSKAHLSAILYL